MTLVMGFATDNYVVFAADRRCTSVENENEYYDDMRKHLRINKKVIAGFSGDFNTTLKCIQHLRKQSLENSTVQAVSFNIRRFLKSQHRKDNKMEQTVIVGGIGAKNKITLIQMTNKDKFQLKKIVPGTNHFNWFLAYADVSPEPIIEKEIHELNEMGESLTAQKAIEIAVKSVKYVSGKDKFVSPSYDIDFLVLK